MKFINFLMNKFTQTVNAGYNPYDDIILCYAPQIDLNTPLILRLINIVADKGRGIKIILLFLGPLTALILAIQNGLNLIKRKTFSIVYAIYKAMQRILLLTFVLTIILILIFYILEKSYYSLDEIIIDFAFFFGIQLVINCLISGLVYMYFFKKSISFLKLGLSLFFILPGIIVFIIIFPLSVITKLNKYLPKDVLEHKKELLKKRLIDQGKLPKDIV